MSLVGCRSCAQTDVVLFTDLKFDNLLFRPPNIDALIARELLLNPSRAYDMEGEVRYGPAAVKPVFASQPLPSWSREREADTLSEIDLVLCDFGFCKCTNTYRMLSC